MLTVLNTCFLFIFFYYFFACFFFFCFVLEFGRNDSDEELTNGIPIHFCVAYNNKERTHTFEHSK